MEGSKPIDKTLCLQWDLVCAILNPKRQMRENDKKKYIGRG